MGTALAATSIGSTHPVGLGVATEASPPVAVTAKWFVIPSGGPVVSLGHGVLGYNDVRAGWEQDVLPVVDGRGGSLVFYVKLVGEYGRYNWAFSTSIGHGYRAGVIGGPGLAWRFDETVEAYVETDLSVAFVDETWCWNAMPGCGERFAPALGARWYL
jgi:hypothetical protein